MDRQEPSHLARFWFDLADSLLCEETKELQPVLGTVPGRQHRGFTSLENSPDW